MNRPPFYFPPEAALPREPAEADQGDGQNQCSYCGGHGYLEDVTEGPDGRDFENEWRCGACDGTGWEQ